MPLVLDLPPDVEDRLRQQAARQGVEPPEYARRLIERHLPAEEAANLSQLMQLWLDEDATDDPAEREAREKEWEEFAQSINSHHSSDRVIYP